MTAFAKTKLTLDAKGPSAARSPALSAALAIPLLLLTAACTTMPSGPNMLALPGTGMSFDQFRIDDQDCRNYAAHSVGGASGDRAQAESIARSAALGTVLGAVAGAAMGNSSSAAAGAGVGLVFGGLAGAGSGQSSGYVVQQRYDNAYVQCMYSKGHRVPVAGESRPVPRSANPPRPYPPQPYYPPPRY